VETFLDIGEKKEIDESSGPSGGASPGGEVERPGEFQRLFRRVHPGRKGNIVFNGGILLDAAGNLLYTDRGKLAARSSLHYGGKGLLVHPSYQGVCGHPPTGGGYTDTIHSY